jgi:hypothetical protein
MRVTILAVLTFLAAASAGVAGQKILATITPSGGKAEALVEDRNFTKLTPEAESTFYLKYGRHSDPNSSGDQQIIATNLQAARCGELNKRIQLAVFAQVQAEFAVTVTPQALATVRGFYQQYSMPRELEQKILTALSDVVDKGQDPAAVYEKELANTGFPLRVWQLNVEQAQTAAGRATLTAYIRNAASTQPIPQAKWDELALSIAMDEAVEKYLSSQDSQFESDLADLRKSFHLPEDQIRSNITALGMTGLKTGPTYNEIQHVLTVWKNFWKEQTAKVSVVPAPGSYLQACTE